MALVAGLIFYKSLQLAGNRLLLIILGLTVLNEGFAHYGVYQSMGINKGYLYNFFFIIELICLFFIFKNIYSGNNYRRAARMALVISIPLAMFFLFKSRLSSFNPMFINIVSICLCFFGFLYLLSIYRLNKVHSLRSDPGFWLSVGVIVVNFFLLLFANATYVDSFRNDPNSAVIFKVLNTLGNIIYYSCLIVSIICSYLLHKLRGI